MPRDPKQWLEDQIKSGRCPDENGYYHYTRDSGKSSKEKNQIISIYMED